MKPADTSTLEQFIKSGTSVSVKYDKFSYLETIPDTKIRLPLYNVIWDYITELTNASVMISLSDEEYSKYRFKPKMLCHDVYGNGECYFIIMILNNMIDVLEFDIREVRMLRKSNMIDLLSYIYNAEHKAIALYNNK